MIASRWAGRVRSISSRMTTAGLLLLLWIPPPAHFSGRQVGRPRSQSPRRSHGAGQRLGCVSVVDNDLLLGVPRDLSFRADGNVTQVADDVGPYGMVNRTDACLTRFNRVEEVLIVVYRGLCGRFRGSLGRSLLALTRCCCEAAATPTGLRPRNDRCFRKTPGLLWTWLDSSCGVYYM